MSADLLAKVRAGGFTPGRRDVPKLLHLFAGIDEADATLVARALAQVPAAADVAEALLAATPPPQPPARHRLVALLARMGADDACARLTSALADADPRTRKAAARGLGRVQNATNRTTAAAALAAALATEARPEVKRALVEALGKVGGAAQLRALEAVKPSKSGPPDVLLGKMQRDAIARVERTRSRQAISSRILDEARPPQPFDLVLRCREGLEGVLATELAPIAGPALVGRVRVRVGSLRDAAAARTWSSVALPLYEGVDSGDDGIARAIASAAPRLAVLTEGPVRWRIEWVGAGHRRAATRIVAETVARLADSRLVNDPIASDWQIEVERGERSGQRMVRVEAVPKSWDDRRFAYRVADVPAASHPTIAAAIARLAGARKDDVVWDPFVGSGLELIERARLGPYRSLLGTDTDERALAAAKRNADAAGVRDLRLVRADARSFEPGRVTLVVTNPPMGRRVNTTPLDPLLTDTLRNVARALAPGGRLVWVTPRRLRTDAVLQRLGLSLDKTFTIAMTGQTTGPSGDGDTAVPFEADLQSWRR